MHDPFVDDMSPEESAMWGLDAPPPPEALKKVSPEEAAAADAWVKTRIAGPPPAEDGPSERTWKIGGLYAIPAPPGKAKLVALDGELGIMDVGTGKVKLKLEIIGDELPDEEPVVAEPPKAKRTRRTKAEMAASRAAEASGFAATEAKALRDEHVGMEEPETAAERQAEAAATYEALGASPQKAKEQAVFEEIHAAIDTGMSKETAIGRAVHETVFGTGALRHEVVIKFDPDTLAVLRKLLGA